MLFAAGLALDLKPVCAIYSTFLQRAFDQIVHDVCLQSLNVVFAMDRAGLVGDDGPTHHGAFDIAYLRCLPNVVLMAPRDEAMLTRMLRTALTYDAGPVALRYPRGEGVGVPLPRAVGPIGIGTGEVLREGAGKVAIVGYGTGVQKGLEAAALLAEGGIDVTVADARFAKPLDGALLAHLAAEHELLVTVEEGVLSGGFSSAVWETLSDGGEHAPRILRVGLPVATHDEARAPPRRGRSSTGAIAARIEAAIGASSGRWRAPEPRRWRSSIPRSPSSPTRPPCSPRRIRRGSRRCARTTSRPRSGWAGRSSRWARSRTW